MSYIAKRKTMARNMCNKQPFIYRMHYLHFKLYPQYNLLFPKRPYLKHSANHGFNSRGSYQNLPIRRVQKPPLRGIEISHCLSRQLAAAYSVSRQPPTKFLGWWPRNTCPPANGTASLTSSTVIAHEHDLHRLAHQPTHYVYNDMQSPIVA